MSRHTQGGRRLDVLLLKHTKTRSQNCCECCVTGNTLSTLFHIRELTESSRDWLVSRTAELFSGCDFLHLRKQFVFLSWEDVFSEQYLFCLMQQNNT